MIKHFKHKGLKLFFDTGSKSGIRPDHAARLARQLRQLNDARSAKEMNMPGWKLHPLAGELAGQWSVTVNGNWRMTFTFEGEDASGIGERAGHILAHQEAQGFTIITKLGQDDLADLGA